MFSLLSPAPDFPPVANAGDDVTIRLPVTSVQLNGAGSTDDRFIVSYRWELTSPTDGNVVLTNLYSPVVDVTNLVDAGTYVFTLTVEDSKFQTSSNNVTVTVLEGKLGSKKQ